MLKGIAHIAFVVSDMDKSLHFYSNILGFKKIYELPDDSGNPWLIYLKVRDGQFIELFYGGERRYTNANAAGFEHYCFEVDDIYEMSNLLEKNGVLDVKPNQGKDYNFQCWAKDPDGNRIEFMQIDSRSPQNNC
ncbi:VOC family protein [Bacillus sp. FJAT-49711]|uniref:VOC family protein n=1 Tax=Bacillus sp. FJAT-49711 TaxID=2833585 RepID=UPI001BCA2F69|nr:VOC family protein [Bacillus sp. FJAT-49711]MBS4218348.1 VOC family protein [Bacillus sp. FJAT-49711]